MSHVLLKNRKTGGLWECPADLVDHYKENGWSDAAKSDSVDSPATSKNES